MDNLIAVKQAADIQVTPEDLLLMALTGEAESILSKLDAAREPWPPRNHEANNYASEIHHPCLRHLVYCRRNWQDRKPMELSGRYRVEEGTKQEWDLTKMLGDVGYQLSRSQERFENKRYHISGKIDGMITPDRPLPAPWNSRRRIELPAEIKTMNPNYWPQTETLFDITRHSAWWISKIPSQLNIYLYMMDLPAGYLILKTFGKRPRIIPMLKDQELWEYDTGRARKVNRHVKDKTYPPPAPYDDQVCGMCGFDHICQPLRETKFRTIDPGDKPELDEYLFLKERKKQFDKEHKRLVGNNEKPGIYFGTNTILDNIQITTKESKKAKFDIPKPVKELFFVRDYRSKTTKIEFIKGAEEKE